MAMPTLRQPRSYFPSKAPEQQQISKQKLQKSSFFCINFTSLNKISLILTGKFRTLCISDVISPISGPKNGKCYRTPRMSCFKAKHKPKRTKRRTIECPIKPNSPILKIIYFDPSKYKKHLIESKRFFIRSFWIYQKIRKT